MSLEVRPATATDLPLLALMNRALIEDEGSRNPMPVEALEHRMTAWLLADWQIDVFADTETILGYAVYQLRNDEYEPERTVVYLRQFFVKREQRRRGLGSRAYGALAKLRFPPGSTIVIDVLESNPDGRRFWSKLGFRPYCTTMHKQARDGAD